MQLMPGESNFNSAINGLFRLLLDPAAVVRWLEALDALDATDTSELALQVLQDQFEIVESLSSRLQPKSAVPSGSYLLLTKDKLVQVCEDSSGSFERLAPSIVPGKVFALRSKSDSDNLDQLIRSLRPGERRFLSVSGNAMEAPITLAVVHLEARAQAQATAVAYMIVAPKAFVWSNDLQDAFRSLDLTEGELRVLRELRTDLTADELASALGVSGHTVRTQIKSLLSKIGMSRQAELVRFRDDAARLSSLIDSEMRAAMADAVDQNPPTFLSGRLRPPRHVISTPGQRRISYREFGHPDGRFVVVLHGSHSGSMIPEGFCPAAHDLHLRLVAPDRPGFGQTSPSEAQMTVADTAREIDHMIKRLGAERYAVVGLAAGAASAIELSSGNPRVTQLMLCSPHFGTARIPGLKPGFGFFFRSELQIRAPWIMEQGSRLVWRNARWEDIRRLSRTFLRKSPADLSYVQRSGLDSYFADVVVDARQSPPDGQASEARILAKYRLDLSRVHVPVILAFGEKDPITDINGFKAVFSKLPDVTHLEFANAGQLFFYPHWRGVLEAIAP